MSVVVPALDVAGLLPRCLDSLLAQTHRPLEIICVDDGSTDDTGDVMARYAAEHPEVRVIRQAHRGVGPARNAALEVARGDFIAMADADDWVEPDFLEDTVRIALATGADVVIGNLAFHAGRWRLDFPFLPKISSMTGTRAAELSLNLFGMPTFAWNKLYRRHLFVPGAPTFPSIWYEDIATTPGLLLRADRVALTPKVYYHYCLRRDSITGTFTVKNVFSFAKSIDLLGRTIRDAGYAERWRSGYRRTLRQAWLMMAIQVVLQPQHIPLRMRVPVLARLARRLQKLG